MVRGLSTLGSAAADLAALGSAAGSTAQASDSDIDDFWTSCEIDDGASRTAKHSNISQMIHHDIKFLAQ